MRRNDDEGMVRSLTRGMRPTLTLPLALFATTITAYAMWVDGVAGFSRPAVYLGVLLAAGLSVVTGSVVARQRGRSRVAAALLLPMLFGAMIGTVVQAAVLASGNPARDLNGLIATTEPLGWVAGGIPLGAVPAAVVAGFLLLAGRVVRRYAGFDASEAAAVVFGGGAGILAAVGLHVIADPTLRGTLLGAVAVAELAVLVALVTDVGRIRFLRGVYAGTTGFDVVPAARFGSGATFTAPLSSPQAGPLVANAGTACVLVRRPPPGGHGAAAGEPLGFLGNSEKATLAPLLRRRVVALVVLVVLTTVAGTATLHGLHPM